MKKNANNMRELFKLEVRKNLCSKKIYIVFLILICLKICYTIFFDTNNINIDLDIYSEYMSELQGKHTEEKYDYIINEIEWYQELQNSQEEYDRQFMLGEITSAQYREILKEIDDAQSTLDVLRYIQVKADYFKYTYSDGEYFYDIDISRYLSNMDMDIFALIFLIFIIAIIFTGDNSTGTEALVITSKYGRKMIMNIRMVITLICAVGISFMFQTAEIVSKAVTINFGNIYAPLKSIIEFSDCTIDVSIKNFIIILFITRLVFFVEIAVICIFIAMKIRKSIAVYTITLGIVVLPKLINDTLPKIIKVIIPGNGYVGTDIYELSFDIFGAKAYITSFICMLLVSIISITYIEIDEKVFKKI